MKFAARTAMVLAVILILTAVILPVPSGAASYSYSNYERAVDLKILGLLANSPDSFELGRAPTRVEGAVMLVRLLGMEKQAKKSSYTHPFSDVPAWADCYIGYMYHNNLTNGIGDSKFGSDTLLSAKQYTTFVLRSIGYYDKIDFDYDNALDKAIQTGLLGASEGASLKKTTTFLRNDLVGISYNALSAKLKASNLSLLDKLVNTDKTIFKPAARVLGLYTSDLKAEFEGVAAYKPAVTQYGSVVKSSNDMFLLLRKTLYSNEGQLKLDVRNYNGSAGDDFEEALTRAKAIVAEITGVSDFVSSWKLLSYSRTLTLTLKYRYTKSDFNQRIENAKTAVNKARYTVARLITADMSEFDKEKKLHDYIVNNTRYDYQNYLKGTIPDESYEEYGCLVLGTAVCEGYSETMKLLCDLSSLECLIITGRAKNGSNWESHAWNLVRIDGAYYHLDATFDDPVSKDGTNTLVYYYFNLPDSEMARSTTWDKSGYPVCTSIENSYYHKNSMIADSRASFDKAVHEALELRRTMIELKVSDYSEVRYSNISISDIVFKTAAVLKYSYSINEELGIIRIYNIQYS